MKDYKTFTLRFKYDDPEHDRILTALEGLDRKKFNCKTKFIIRALSHYIDHLNLTDAEELYKDRLHRIENLFVMRKEFDSELAAAKAEIRADLYRDVISYVKEVNSIGNKHSEITTDSNGGIATSQTPDDLSIYANIMENVIHWSEDD